MSAPLTEHQALSEDAAAPDPRGSWRPRSDASRAAHQVAGIDAFNRSRRQVQSAQAAAAARSRRTRMDVAPRLDVLHRQHDAVVERAQQSLERSGDAVLRSDVRTALLAHRDDELLVRVSQALLDRGLEIIGTTNNGADAVGYAVVEQPDVVLVEDALAMLPGPRVIADVLRYCPATRVVAHASHADRVGALLDVGAAAVYTRAVPPVDIAVGMDRLVRA